MQVAEAQYVILRKNYISQPLSSNIGHEANASSYKVMKPLTKERGKKGKVVGHKVKPNAQAKKDKGQHEAHLAIAGTEDQHPLVALMDVDSPIAAPMTPPFLHLSFVRGFITL